MSRSSYLALNYAMIGLLLTVGCIGKSIAQSGNTAYGNAALISITNGWDNSAFGDSALASDTSGWANTAVGNGALASNATSGGNTALGAGTLEVNTLGNYNTAVGLDALYTNNSGSYNAAIGLAALTNNTSGGENSAFGTNSLYSNTRGSDNTALGVNSLRNNTVGISNIAVGQQALFGNTSGNYNIGIGFQAGYVPKTGVNNIEIGNKGLIADTGVIRIGIQGTQRFTQVAGISGVNVTGGVPVLVNSKGQLGVVSSSRRYKQDIRSMGDTSDRLLKLRPVTFRYRQPDESGQKPEQYGLIAEEVAKVMPELVVYNDKGQPETVAYQTLAPLLLNELQKEHAAAAAQSREIADLRSRVSEIEALRVEVAALRKGQ